MPLPSRQDSDHGVRFSAILDLCTSGSRTINFAASRTGLQSIKTYFPRPQRAGTPFHCVETTENYTFGPAKRVSRTSPAPQPPLPSLKALYGLLPSPLICASAVSLTSHSCPPKPRFPSRGRAQQPSAPVVLWQKRPPLPWI